MLSGGGPEEPHVSSLSSVGGFCRATVSRFNSARSFLCFSDSF